jgi:hypothetical protein
MDVDIARKLARRLHSGQVDRLGEPMIDHVERVASAVPEQARVVAYLHDVLERTRATARQLRTCGLTGADCSALMLLTHDESERYDAYIDRIARADGAEGRIARTVKIADLDDHLRHRVRASAPNYASARSVIADAQERRHEASPARWRTVEPAA